MALAIRIPGAGPAIERARRLGAVRHQALASVIGAVTRGDELWVISDLDGGISLADALSVGLPSPGAAVFASLSILSGLAALHGAGLAHGSLAAEGVRILPDGSVRLAGFGLTGLLGGARTGDAELSADIRAAGEIVCRMLGIPPGMAPASPLTPLESTRPALAAAARRIAAPEAPRGGLTALAAHGLLEEASGVLSEAEAKLAGQTELSRYVVAFLSGTPPPEPPPPPAPVPIPPLGSPGIGAVAEPVVAAAAQAAGGLKELASTAASAAAGAAPRLREQVESIAELAPSPPGRGRAGTRPAKRGEDGPGRWLLMAALAALALVPMIVIAANLANPGAGPRTATGAPAASPTAKPRPSASPAATPTPQPSPSPSAAAFGPAAAPPITSVVLTLPAGCQAGSTCNAHVQVNMKGLTSSGPVAWDLKLVDCSGNVTAGPSDSVDAQAGWTYVYGDRQVQIPSAPTQVVAVTTAPAQAASAPVAVGTCPGAPAG